VRLTNGSGVKREFHAPFCERLVGQFCWSTLPDFTEEIITEIFGKEVARHVEGLTRIKPYGKISSEESLNLLVRQKRYNTALIKLFDRIHNIQTLGTKSPEKARKIIEESLISFVKIAIYIEAHEIKQQLIKLCYKNLGIDFNKPQITFQDNFQLLSPIF